MTRTARDTSARDAALIAACLAGDASAWETLIDTYKRLIYSVPLRYRLSPEDAADVFQFVCLDLYRGLASLRDTAALGGWLARVAAHHSLRLKNLRGRMVQDDAGLDSMPSPDETGSMIHRAEQSHLVRQAVDSLPGRCREMIRMLFYSDPPPTYDEVAARFGIAKGSIGFIRGRCLRKLEKALTEAGL